MVNHKEILRLKSLGLTHREITDATGCGRNTVTRTLARAREQKLSWPQAQSMSQQEVSQRLFPIEQKDPVYKMPDYEWVHREMQKSGVTLSLLWVEYCEQCRQSGELPYPRALQAESDDYHPQVDEPVKAGGKCVCQVEISRPKTWQSSWLPHSMPGGS